MTEEHPSNAVLAEKIDSLSKNMTAGETRNHEAQVVIIAQVTKTNGRTTALEKTVNMIKGALIFLHIVIIPIAIALVIKLIINS